jgi:C1A family cysteine protease
LILYSKPFGQGATRIIATSDWFFIISTRFAHLEKGRVNSMTKATSMRPIAFILMGMIVSLMFSSLALAEKSEDEQLAEIRKMIEEKGYHWTAGKTSVSGLSDAEKARLLGYIQPPDYVLQGIPRFTASLDTITDVRFDWRDFGGVTPAKNQGSCGSCWAFCAVSEIESHMLIYDNRYEDLSEQQILSCNTTGGSCGGGWMYEAYNIFLSQGAVTEACMPYEADDTVPCTEDQCTHLAWISDYFYIPNEINDIKQAVLNGAVSTTFQAMSDFFYYEEGCYENDSGVQRINHAVIILGWDDSMCDGQGAWICKNSWGEDWGENGFFYIRYGDIQIGSNSSQIIYNPSAVLVHLESPNGGEEYVSGGEYEVAWTTDREAPDSLELILSTNEGALYDQAIVTDLEGTGTFEWKVPMFTAAGAKLMVRAYSGGGVGGLDTSDDLFVILEDVEAPTIAVTHPNGGESYNPGDTVDIEWIASDNACVETIDIYYSENGGADYTVLAMGEEDDSLYEWIIPQELGDSCIVKVVAWDPSSHAAEDESDEPFYVTSVSTDVEDMPGFTNRLEQNYPNPFNGTTTITYSIAEHSEVDVRIYDTAGRLVSVLERTTREPGRYSTVWRGTDREGRAVTSGVYFCSIKAGGF